jgi:hypothetical protein
MLRRWTLCLPLLLGALVAGPATARADEPTGPGGSVGECANQYICVGAYDPGSPGGTSTGGSGGSSGGDGRTCSWNGRELPCWDPDMGWFNSADGCYYRKAVPQPPADDLAWGGHDPSTGAIYDYVCPYGATVGSGQKWFATPPGGTPPPDPAVLAQQAVRQLPLDQPVLHTAPGDDGTPLVGLPLWLWYDRADGRTSGRPRAQVTAGGVTVRAEAVLTSVEWDLGDGGPLKRCTGPGTPYEARYGSAESPDCGYRYSASSAGRPGEQYSVTATLHWRVTATVAGTGVQPIPPIEDYPVISQVLQLRVSEAQVLN